MLGEHSNQEGRACARPVGGSTRREVAVEHEGPEVPEVSDLKRQSIGPAGRSVRLGERIELDITSDDERDMLAAIYERHTWKTSQMVQAARAILVRGKHMYRGTVSWEEKQKRRTRGKRQRLARARSRRS